MSYSKRFSVNGEFYCELKIPNESTLFSIFNYSTELRPATNQIRRMAGWGGWGVSMNLLMFTYLSI